LVDIMTAQKSVGLDSNVLTKAIGGQDKIIQPPFNPNTQMMPPNMMPPMENFQPTQNFRMPQPPVREDSRTLAMGGLAIKDNAFSIPGITRKRKKKVIKQKIKRKKCSCKKK
jgi:hypothetical protein